LLTSGKATSVGLHSLSLCLLLITHIFAIVGRIVQDVRGKDIAAGAQEPEGVCCVLDHAVCD
jgi:hypothetical protein